jgi:hypothetical protein
MTTEVDIFLQPLGGATSVTPSVVYALDSRPGGGGPTSATESVMQGIEVSADRWIAMPSIPDDGSVLIGEQ